MNMKFLKKPLIPILLIFLLLGYFVSTLDYRVLAYNHADWLIKKELMSVFKFYSKQQDELSDILDHYMAWHRKVMLKNYISYLGDLDDRLRALELDQKKFSPEEIDGWIIRGRDLYISTVAQLADNLIPLLVQLNESQVSRAQTLMDRRLEQWRELKEASSSKLLEDLRFSWQGNFDFILGSMNSDQEEALTNSINHLYIPPSFQLAYEGKLNQELLTALESIQSDGKETAAKKLDGVIQYWHRESDFKNWRIEASKLFSKVLNLASNEQIAHFRSKIHNWRELMVGLLNEK